MPRAFHDSYFPIGVEDEEEEEEEREVYVCVCMCVCVCVCLPVCLCVCVSVCAIELGATQPKFSMMICVNYFIVQVLVCTYRHTGYVCVSACTSMCTYVCANLCASSFVRTYVRVCVHTCCAPFVRANRTANEPNSKRTE